MKPIKGIYAYLFALFATFSGINAAHYDLTGGLPYVSPQLLHQPSGYLQQTQTQAQPQSLNPEAKLFIPKDLSTLPPEAKKYVINEAFKTKDIETLEKLGFTIGPDNSLWHLATEDWKFVQSRNLIDPLLTTRNIPQSSHTTSALQWSDIDEITGQTANPTWLITSHKLHQVKSTCNASIYNRT